MTRINVVPPQELTTKHLVAEYRELPRLYALARAAIGRGEQPNDKRNPIEYTLGTGHVRFFYSRIAFIRARHLSLCVEMIARGYVVNFWPPVDEWPEPWFRQYEPTPDALRINRDRIRERSNPPLQH